MMKKLSFILLIAIIGVCSAQNPKAEGGSFALMNATIHTVTNGTLENSNLLIKDGKIARIGELGSLGADVKKIDCSGLHVFPGMIDSGTSLGLVEVSSVDRTDDSREIGNVIPHMKALTAVNPNSALIPVTRVSGVTTVLTVPEGGLFPGQAALINLHGYTPDQMSAGFSAAVMNFPSSGKRGWWDRRSDEEIEKETRENMKELADIWTKVEQYHELDSIKANGGTSVSMDYYPEMKALLPVYRKEVPLMIEVNKEKDIRKALEWVEETGVRAILTGVEEGFRVADEIAEAGIPVIVGPTLSTPARDYDRYDRPYTNPSDLMEAGVKVAIRTSEAENVRNLPYNAGFAAAYGMTEEEAFKAISIIPAELFQVSDKLGSLEEGKQATLFISTGHPFETSTDVEHVFINGWKIPMQSRHTELYEEFLQRSPGLEK
ncbi:amidohydrolase family protein [Gramella sp. GC03-9]|uniref:Amidohydrolase family protein n=1 Tax=Christiangramia oceanisediminis TaxID=2920386 RepID=A0A9X2I4S4_9FLAO|nr:amidohydrolase family protein [Gramella oceanisediminis]MCP9199840.1 amidohydrolase family protein [Gramella oceanisediminis]